MKTKSFSALMAFLTVFFLAFISWKMERLIEVHKAEAQATRDVIKAAALLNHLDNKKY